MRNLSLIYSQEAKNTATTADDFGLLRDVTLGPGLKQLSPVSLHKLHKE
jgi:hypothetical protein